MAGPSVHIDTAELSLLITDIGRAERDITPQVGRAVAKTAHDIEADAKAIAPVDTGYLKGSISTDVDRLSAEIGPTASYGEYVENGTSRMGPQPYMRPAFDRQAPRLVDAIAQLGERAL